MKGRARALGHSIHPMLIVFPLGLLVTAVVFDLVYLLGGDDVFASVAYWDIAAGLIGGALAAVAGLVDWLSIPNGTRAKRIGLLHAGGNATVMVLFLISLIGRAGGDHEPNAGWFILELVALGIGTVGAWLGGELVERLGIGVDTGANVDAPSSLSKRPASPGRTATA